MRILMITPYLPYPLVSGGQIRTYNLLKNLAKKHQITLVSFIRNIEEKRYLQNLEKYCQKVEVVQRRPAWSWQNIILAGFSHLPFLISIYYSFTAKKILTKLLNEENFNLIHAETFYVMPNIPATSVPVLLVEQTIEYLVYDHFVNLAPLILRPVLFWDVLKIKLWEKHFWSKAAIVVATSVFDAKIMTKLVPSLSVEIIPNGVDVDFFSQQLAKTKKNPTLLFVGNFKWLQNREAVQFLVRKIWPEISTAIPAARLWIVGKNPTGAIKNLANSQISVDDQVEDIRVAYQNSDVLLAPIFGPGGTRYKILEAMASDLPVVTTKTGIEGIPAKNGVEVKVGENEETLAEIAVELLKNKEKAAKIAQKAKSLVGNQFNWVKIAEKLDTLYKKVGYARERS